MNVYERNFNKTNNNTNTNTIPTIFLIHFQHTIFHVCVGVQALILNKELDREIDICSGDYKDNRNLLGFLFSPWL